MVVLTGAPPAHTGRRAHCQARMTMGNATGSPSNSSRGSTITVSIRLCPLLCSNDGCLQRHLPTMSHHHLAGCFLFFLIFHQLFFIQEFVRQIHLAQQPMQVTPADPEFLGGPELVATAPP